MSKTSVLKKIAVVVIAIIALMIIGILIYYYTSDGSSRVKAIERYEVTYVSDEDGVSNAESIDIQEWMKNYLGQYEEWYIPNKQKIMDFNIEGIEQLVADATNSDYLGGVDTEDKFYSPTNIYNVEVVQVDFTVTVPTTHAKLATQLDGLYDVGDKKQIRCQWVLYYQVSSTGQSRTVKVWKEMRPAAYDIMQYNQSGQAEIDRYNTEKEQQETKLQYNSEGKAIGQLDGSKFWLTNSIGYNAKIIDRCMSQEFRTIFGTQDGGTTWNEIGQTPSNWQMNSYCFITEDIGFFCYKQVEGEKTNFYRTKDGGVTFDGIILPTVEVEYMGSTYTPFTTPEAPWKEDETLCMYLAQDENGDYEGGTCKALLISQDDGKTWEYTGRIVKFQKKEEG